MKSHGNITLTWKGDILFVDAFGPFNEEGVISAGRQYLDAIHKRNGAKFSVIETWDEQSLSSPAGMQEAGKLWELLLAHNCQSIAIVVCNSLQRGLVAKMLPSIGTIFDTTLEAEDWLVSRNDK